jgi:hypothetical protein
MMYKLSLTGLSLVCLLISCKEASKNKKEEKAATDMANYTKGSFGYDLNFLQQKDSGLIILKSSDGESQILVSPRYQAKVFTSAAAGLNGKSFGWVNYKAFEAPVDMPI